MMRAKLFVDDRKTITVEETEQTVTIHIESAVQALKVTGLLLAARRYGEATDWDSGKDIVIDYGLLSFSL
jgi:hypothetical protein